MSKNTQNTQTAGKAYDSKLMKRLLTYTKPYWKLLLLSLLLLVFITGLELLNPYLLKLTIDDHINGYKQPMYQVSIDNPMDGIIYRENKYIKQKTISADEELLFINSPIKKILKDIIQDNLIIQL